MKKLILLFTVIALTFSCSSDSNSNSNNDNNFAENFGNVVNRNFIGQIVNENSQPIEGVEIKIGSITKYTDSKGVFVIKDAEVYEKFAYITAKKAGFINGSRNVVPNSESNTIKIMMLTATVQATVASGTASNVVLSNGTKVTFDGAFKTEAGAAYSGSVKVMMHHLDPSDATTKDKMPGSLMGENSNSDQCVLESYGMLNIELQDASGNKLQIANPTNIEMPINALQSASAPNTIPLWYFDEMLGYWKEEGSATKVGNKYVGTVNHFSWWNCDDQFPTISLSVTVLTNNQLPMEGVQVELVRSGPSGGWNVPGYTNNLGQVSGLVPANESLTMNIYYYNSTCGNQLIYSQQIGPFSSNAVLPTVILPSLALQTTIVQGNLVNCSNSAVTNGYLWLQYSGRILYTPIYNGSFSFTVLNCSIGSTSYILQGFDFDGMNSTTQQIGTLNNQTINIGTIQSCTSTNTSGAFFDIDQNVYTYLPIGPYVWMQQNLNVSKYTDGTPIPQVTDPSAWANLTTGAWCYFNNDYTNSNPIYGVAYGKLYNWYAVAGVYDSASFSNPLLRKKLAPSGWHVPTNAEWNTLGNAGGTLKEAGISNWISPNTGATNSTGFTGLPGGYRSSGGGCYNIGEDGIWWSSSEYVSSVSLIHCLNYYNTDTYSYTNSTYFYSIPNFSYNLGFSVRCIKD
ncbi:MAG: hypothetical protein EBS55_08270 [Flavobacteriaceae bacterium]|nr:hypothetical protein [Flavobacteriaceae bacterium]